MQVTDLDTQITYLDAGTADQRIDTVTYSSPMLYQSSILPPGTREGAAGGAVRETMTYSGSAGSYRLTRIVRSWVNL